MFREATDFLATWNGSKQRTDYSLTGHIISFLLTMNILRGTKGSSHLLAISMSALWASKYFTIPKCPSKQAALIGVELVWVVQFGSALFWTKHSTTRKWPAAAAHQRGGASATKPGADWSMGCSADWLIKSNWDICPLGHARKSTFQFVARACSSGEKGTYPLLLCIMYRRKHRTIQ